MSCKRCTVLRNEPHLAQAGSVAASIRAHPRHQEYSHVRSHFHFLARRRSRRSQDPPASRLVRGQLCRRGHHAADRRREPVRSARPALGRARARRRRRQRQCHACGRAPLVRRDLHRLCVLAARVRAGARAGRRPHDRVPGGRRREPAVLRRVVRRGDVHLRRDVHARTRTRRRASSRASASPAAGSAWRTGRPRASSGNCSRRSASTSHPRRASNHRRCGARRQGSRSSSAKPRRRSARRAASSSSAIARRHTGSKCSARTTVR